MFLYRRWDRDGMILVGNIVGGFYEIIKFFSISGGCWGSFMGIEYISSSIY